MPNKTYSPAFRAEVVAAARVTGAEAAATTYGVDVRSVHRWADAAMLSLGASELPRDELEDFERLAYAKLQTQVAGGKVRGTQLATVWGIVRDKLDRRNREQPVAATPDVPAPVVAFCDRVDAFCAALEPEAPDRWLGVICHVLEDDPDATLPRDVDTWCAKTIGSAPDPRAWHAEHRETCPSVRRPVPVPGPTLAPDLAALVAEAYQYLQGA